MVSIISLDDPPARERSRRGLRSRILSAVTFLVAVLLIAYATVADPRPASRTPSETALPAAAAPEPMPRLVVPASVAAGSTLVLLAYRDAGLCGPTEVRLDGARLEISAIGGVASSSRSFVSLRIPAHTSAGSHRIELYGPMRAAGGALCGDAPEHQARIATATITVHASRQLRPAWTTGRTRE